RALQISNSQLTGQTWGDKTVNISGITDVTQAGGGVTSTTGGFTGESGYLLRPNGSYYTSSEYAQIKEGYKNWQNYPNTALADTAGWKNTKALITEQGSDYQGGATTTFRNDDSVNQGYTDWFIPAEGQLAYIYLNMTAINTLLAKCSNPAGATLMQNFYWSSSEHSASQGRTVGFYEGYVTYTNKKTKRYVRFLRDLN
ncbi:MAG: hypothetical protein SPE11_06400, partial [Parabacteroides sp.]|nr:hypothetical protein [Parabacteroides sp.]